MELTEKPQEHTILAQVTIYQHPDGYALIDASKCPVEALIAFINDYPKRKIQVRQVLREVSGICKSNVFGPDSHLPYWMERKTEPEKTKEPLNDQLLDGYVGLSKREKFEGPAAKSSLASSRLGEEFTAPQEQKPPLGVQQRILWVQQRLQELDAAMDRYRAAGMSYPLEWGKEWSEHTDEVEKHKRYVGELPAQATLPNVQYLDFDYNGMVKAMAEAEAQVVNKYLYGEGFNKISDLTEYEYLHGSKRMKDHFAEQHSSAHELLDTLGIPKADEGGEFSLEYRIKTLNNKRLRELSELETQINLSNQKHPADYRSAWPKNHPKNNENSLPLDQ